MEFWKSAANYIGQVRVYSIVDLALLLIVLKSTYFEFIGAIFLHVGFLLYLEYRHQHAYRKKFPPGSWLIFAAIGIMLYHHLSVVGFIFFGFIYAEKKKNNLGIFASLFRGIQVYFLAAGVVGFTAPMAFLAASLIAARNFAGDIRDITKDKKEGLKTLPMFIGLKKERRNIHLIMVLATSAIWWYLSPLSILWLLGAEIIEALTYQLTPR